MFELSQEKTLMYASDNSVTLTTHRIIHKKENVTEQVMLVDFISYELIKKHIGNYRVLTIFFTITTIVLLAQSANLVYHFRNIIMPANINDILYLVPFPANISLLFLIISLFFLLVSRRYFIRINGKYNHFEFRVRSFKNKSFKKFLQTLTVQSDKMKKIINWSMI